MERLKVGVFSFTCCEGCCISVIESLNDKFFDWKNRVDFVNFRALKKVRDIERMDVAFVEGAISSEEEVVRLREIRENALILIALGSGAANGWPSNLRNDFKGAKKKKVMKLVKSFGQNEKVLPLKEFVEVDDLISGCPINRDDFAMKLDELILCFGKGEVLNGA